VTTTRILFVGGLVAVALSLGAAYVLQALNPRFGTPDEVHRVLDVPSNEDSPPAPAVPSLGGLTRSFVTLPVGE
jgi:hypothetical protein